jgi:DNA-directed RNA polymerase beta subunit
MNVLFIITKEIPRLKTHFLRNLDRNGIVMLGSWVETRDIMFDFGEESSFFFT